MSERSPWSEVRERLATDWTEPVRRPDQVVLEERARRLARLAAEPAPVTEEVLRTRVGGAILAWPAARVRSVDRLPRWLRLPSTPRHLLGLTRVGGSLAPVFDVGPMITGRSTELGADARLVTVTGAGPDLSFVVEAVLDTDVSSEAPRPAPEDGPAFVVGLASGGDLSIDPDALLSDPLLLVDQTDEL